MMLQDQIRQAIIELQKKYPHKRSALIPALLLAQQQEGYLPLEIQEEIAALFDLKLTEIKSVVSFYDMFYERPMGKKLIHVCKNVSCMLRGSDELTDSICKRLQVKVGGTTEDGKYTLLTSECLGACDKAPMMLFDELAIGPIKESDLEHIFKD